MQKLLLLSVIFLSSILLSHAEPAPSDSVISLGEVSVSAIKATSPVPFPSAQTTITRAQISSYDIYGIKGASEIAPNFYMPQYGSRMTSTIYVRGLGTRIDQPVIAMNVDNVQILNKDNYDFNFPDMRGIEVIRGAQSILYGRNSMGGVVNISTISPLNYQGIRADLQAANGNSWRTSLSGYFKPSETLGIGIIGAMSSTDGFFRNLYTGDKLDKERQGFTKVKLTWRPNSRFHLENSAWVALLRQGGYPYEFLETGQISHNDTCFYRRTTVIDGLTMRYDLDKFTVSSITGFQYHKDNLTLDQDFLPEDYFTLSQRRHEWSFTQDFVLKGQSKSYSWLAGLYGFYRRYNMQAPVTFKDYGITHLLEDNINSQLPPAMQLRWDDREMVLNSDFVSPIWGVAAYHKSELRLGKFNLSAGLRLAFERTNFEYTSDNATSLTMYRQAGPKLVPLMSRSIKMVLHDRLHMTSLQLLPEVKAAYEFTPGVSLGLVVSKGYKSGGYNTQIFSDILKDQLQGSMMELMKGDVDVSKAADPEIAAYKPETSWNYEIDIAASLPEHGLSLDASAFFIDCRNQQMTVFPDAEGTGRMMANAGRTRSVGVELSATYSPIDPLRLFASYGMTDARFRSFNDGKTEYRGKHVPYAPANTLFASAAYNIKLNSKTLRAIEPMLSCRAVGRIYWNESNEDVQPFYAMLNASVNFTLPYVNVELWAENITDTKYATFYFESVGHKFVQRGTPRRFGVTARFNFEFK